MPAACVGKVPWPAGRTGGGWHQSGQNWPCPNPCRLQVTWQWQMATISSTRPPSQCHRQASCPAMPAQASTMDALCMIARAPCSPNAHARYALGAPSLPADQAASAPKATLKSLAGDQQGAQVGSCMQTMMCSMHVSPLAANEMTERGWWAPAHQPHARQSITRPPWIDPCRGHSTQTGCCSPTSTQNTRRSVRICQRQAAAALRLLSRSWACHPGA
jgi:hypothetical protein